MKAALVLVGVFFSGAVFANDPFSPDVFVGSYHVDHSRSDADCIDSDQYPVQVQGDALNLKVFVAGSADSNAAIGGADIEFEEINQPAQQSGDDGFDQYSDVSSCAYLAGALTQNFDSHDAPYPETIETTQLQKNADGSLTLSRTTSGMQMDGGPASFRCTLLKN
jgi:hypothetical protein